MKFTDGTIMNLMSTDASRIDFACGYCHIGWVALIQICIILAILLVNMGPSALVGFSLLLVFAAILTRVVRKVVRSRFESTIFTDARVRLTQEILQSMRLIKYHTWEKLFLAKIAEMRRSELKVVSTLVLIRGGINAVSTTIPVYASILAFVLYSSTGHALNPANVFSSLTLFTLLRTPLMTLPVVIASSTDAWVALKRVQNILLAEELKETIVIDPQASFAVSVEGGWFEWDVEIEEPGETNLTKPRSRCWHWKKGVQNKVEKEIETEPEEEGGSASPKSPLSHGKEQFKTNRSY
jgi:ATP-binding cassette, subfamily C (CFTR/MRP), member 1